MYIIAKTYEDKPFIYNPKTAHRFTKGKGEEIVQAINEIRYKLNDGEIWKIHEIDEYDTAYDYSEYNRFIYGKYGIKEKAAF